MTLSSRVLSPKDLERIREIHRKYHNFPFSNPHFNVGSSVVENEEGLIVGAGYLRPIVEAIMYLDLSQSSRTKVEALRLMIRDGIKFADSMHLPEIHLFAEDDKFREILKKHFDFVEPKATALVRNIDG